MKMSTQALLEISPDKFFEEHGISEIQKIQSQIQNEIERKREELRNMVGERYRDLLKAADTISEMKDTSKEVIDHVNQMSKLCQALQEKRLIGFKQIQSGTSNRFSDSEGISKIIEMKILLSLPEQIWTAIDNNNYLLAAQLFLLATHVHLGVKVSPNAESHLKKFPVLAKQWEIISSCRKIITDGARHELRTIDLSFKKTSECLSCLFLLEVISLEKLIQLYLELRLQTLRHIFKSDEYKNVKQKLRVIVILLQCTLAALYHCFLEKSDQKHSIFQQLENITGTDAKPTLSKIKQVTSLPECYLSPLITDFHPKTTNDISGLPHEVIQNKVAQWMSNVEKLLETELVSLLTLVIDIKRLHNINEQTISLQYPSNWNVIVEALLPGEIFDIFKRFIKSYMTKRVVALIELIWQNAVDNVVGCLQKTDEELKKDRVKEAENDVRWFVWKEDKNVTEECLRLKTQGYTSRVVKLCSSLDNSLSLLLQDISLYLGPNILTGTKTDVEAYSLQIISFLNSCSFRMVKKLTETVRQSCRPGENESSIILRCRFLQSLITQCPNLEKCLKESQRQINEESEDNRTTWQQTVTFLNEEGINMWRIWKARVEKRLHGLMADKLSSQVSLRNLLMSKPLSEVITIEEQTEDGTTVKSDIRVPSQPSLPLQDLLFQACQILNATAPHTIPRCVHQELMDSFVKDILNHYLQLSRSQLIYQSQAWQMLLDIRLLALLLVTRDNKDKSEALCEILEKMIDPFDLDVYYPYLQNNIKKSVQRLQGTLGILINFSEKLPVFNGLKLTQSNPATKIDEPNILAMSSNIPWFPLLPISNAGARRTESTASKENIHGKVVVKSKEKENRKETTPSDFVRSAGAFFGAMTGGWS